MLAQKLILSYSSKILVQFIQIPVTIIVARVAGPTVLGTVAFGLAFVNLFHFIADLGIGTAHIKLLSEGKDEASCIGTFARIKLFLIGSFSLVVLGAFFVQKYIFHYNFESSVHEKVILISLVALAIQMLFSIPKTTFLAKTEQAKQDIPDFIRAVIFQLLRLVVVLLGYKAVAIASSNLVAALLIIPFYIVLFKDYPIGRFDKTLAKQYISISMPIIIIGFAQTGIYWTDKVILQYLTNSQEVGYYVAGFKIGGFILMVGNAAGLLFFPMFSEAIAKKQFKEINRNIRKYERFLLSFVFPATVVIAMSSDLIVRFILGIQYVNSIPILSIITISMFIMTFTVPYGNVLAGKGLFKLLAKLYVLQFIFFLAISSILVLPQALNLKGVGIAYALLLSNIFVGSLFIVFSKKNLKDLAILPARYFLVFAISYSGIGFVICNYFFVGVMAKLCFVGIYFLGYWGISNLFGVMGKGDWNVIGSLVDVRKMRGYIRSEIKR